MTWIGIDHPTPTSFLQILGDLERQKRVFVSLPLTCWTHSHQSPCHRHPYSQQGILSLLSPPSLLQFEYQNTNAIYKTLPEGASRSDTKRK